MNPIKVALCSLGSLFIGATAAQPYPSKTIKLIVPVSAGGGSDMVGRAVADRLSRALGQTVIVENIGGGGGVLGTQATQRAAPDGYTLMLGYVATHGTNPAVRKVPYDAVKDFTPIGMVGTTPNVLVVTATLPIQNFSDFLAYVRANDSKMSYGSSGQGSLTQLSMEMLKQQINSDMVHVPYKGIAPAITDLLGGQTQTMMPGLAAALPHLKGGKMRAIAVTGEKRHPLLPDVPTFAELGFKAVDSVQWYGIVGPAKLPADIVKRLSETLRAAITAPDFREKLQSEAIDPAPMSPEQFGDYIKSEVARWTQIAKSKNITAD
jgi:tripartite-type tricarboxylate transporter receptor subunit TctC